MLYEAALDSFHCHTLLERKHHKSCKMGEGHSQAHNHKYHLPRQICNFSLNSCLMKFRYSWFAQKIFHRFLLDSPRTSPTPFQSIGVLCRKFCQFIFQKCGPDWSTSRLPASCLLKNQWTFNVWILARWVGLCLSTQLPPPSPPQLLKAPSIRQHSCPLQIGSAPSYVAGGRCHELKYVEEPSTGNRQSYSSFWSRDEIEHMHHSSRSPKYTPTNHAAANASCCCLLPNAMIMCHFFMEASTWSHAS
jgi:hypothetical protein